MSSLASAQLKSDQVLLHRDPTKKAHADLGIRLPFTLLSKLKLKANKDGFSLSTVTKVKKGVTKATAPEKSLWPKIIFNDYTIVGYPDADKQRKFSIRQIWLSFTLKNPPL